MEKITIAWPQISTADSSLFWIVSRDAFICDDTCKATNCPSISADLSVRRQESLAKTTTPCPLITQPNVSKMPADMIGEDDMKWPTSTFSVLCVCVWNSSSLVWMGTYILSGLYLSTTPSLSIHLYIHIELSLHPPSLSSPLSLSLPVVVSPFLMIFI